MKLLFLINNVIAKQMIEKAVAAAPIQKLFSFHHSLFSFLSYNQMPFAPQIFNLVQNRQSKYNYINSATDLQIRNLSDGISQTKRVGNGVKNLSKKRKPQSLLTFREVCYRWKNGNKVSRTMRALINSSSRNIKKTDIEKQKQEDGKILKNN